MVEMQGSIVAAFLGRKLLPSFIQLYQTIRPCSQPPPVVRSVLRKLLIFHLLIDSDDCMIAAIGTVVECQAQVASRHSVNEVNAQAHIIAAKVFGLLQNPVVSLYLSDVVHHRRQCSLSTIVFHLSVTVTRGDMNYVNMQVMLPVPANMAIFLNGHPHALSMLSWGCLVLSTVVSGIPHVWIPALTVTCEWSGGASLRTVACYLMPGFLLFRHSDSHFYGTGRPSSSALPSCCCDVGSFRTPVVGGCVLEPFHEKNV